MVFLHLTNLTTQRKGGFIKFRNRNFYCYDCKSFAVQSLATCKAHSNIHLRMEGADLSLLAGGILATYSVNLTWRRLAQTIIEL